MAFFRKASAQPLTQRELLLNRFKASRSNLLLVVGFSLINIIMLLSGSTSYFLFSAYIPYSLACAGMLYCGRLPSEYYADIQDMEILDSSFFIIMIAAALAIIALYAMAWFFSKKLKLGWLIFSLILFCIDTGAMFYFNGFSVDSTMDVLFHSWVIFSLITGICACIKLKKLPEDENFVAETPVQVDAANTETAAVYDNIRNT